MASESHAPPAVDPAYERALKKVRAIKGLYVHTTTYCVVIAGLFLINLASGRPWWFFWPAFGWGIGLAAHALRVYGLGGFLGEDWEERKLREVLEKEKRRAS